MKGSEKRITPLRMLVLTLALLLSSFAVLVQYSFGPPSGKAPRISLAEVYRLADKGQIRIATLLDEDAVIFGQKCSKPGRSAEEGDGTRGASSSACKPPTTSFQASYPRSDVSTAQLIERMTSSGAEVEVNKQTGTAIIKLVLTFLYPLLILANLFGIIFLARGGDSSMGDLAGFSKIDKKGNKKAKGGRKGKGGEPAPTTGVTFANIGGAQESVTELREVTEYLTNPKKFEAYGAAAPKGVLLFGPPGCGKTLMARAVAGEAGVPFFSVSGAEFIESLVGVGAARVRDLFRQVREVAPAIVFIDEIDAVGRKRSGEGSTGGEREQTVNQLLVELDGFEVSAGIVLMGATNRPDILDPALLRPGRFDRHITLEAPDLHGRVEILRLHAEGKPFSESVDFEDLARRTPGFTGADLANVINEGALLAIRQGETEIGAEALAEAVQRVLHGPMRRGKLMTAEERKRLAYHEAGHALVAAGLGRADAVQRISIVARGGGLGASAISDAADRVLLTKSEIETSLAIAMGGAAAEIMVFSEPSTTASDDLAKANAMARDMVGIHGMSSEIGPLRLLATDAGFLSEDPRLVQTVSSQSLSVFDSEIKSFIQAAEQTCKGLLAANRTHLDNLAEALEQDESLEGPALAAMLAFATPNLAFFEEPKPKGTNQTRERRPLTAK